MSAPNKKIYLIAGEASGDFLGAQLMKAIKRQQKNVEFFGVGGDLMSGQGMESLFPMEELSVMGIWEIAPKIFKLLRRIRQTAEDIERLKPDVVITIDAPDFSFRVLKRLRGKMQNPPKMVHYVAPTVWAWRPKRAEKVSKFLDAMICLFDFEPPYFEKEGLKAISVGHPMMESGVMSAAPVQTALENSVKLGVFFGSRQGEIKRMSPVFLEVVRRISGEVENLELIIPTLPHLEDKIRGMIEPLGIPYVLSTNAENKWGLFKTCDAAVAVSGTVGLELAAADVPHVIGYKMNALTAMIVRRLIKTPYAHLANIMMGREIVPEFIQEHCNAEDMSNEVMALLDDVSIRQEQLKAFEDVRRKIGEDTKPSDKAAAFVLSL